MHQLTSISHLQFPVLVFNFVLALARSDSFGVSFILLTKAYQLYVWAVGFSVLNELISSSKCKWNQH
jgi:hypothetical protein